MRPRSIPSGLLAAVGVPLLRLAWDYFDYGSVAHQAMQISLKLFGSAMYEYHSATGRWPASLDGLAQASLSQRSRLWKQTASALVFLWPQDSGASGCVGAT